MAFVLLTLGDNEALDFSNKTQYLRYLSVRLLRDDILANLKNS